jgi:alpha-ribazole phosphatase
MAKYCRSYCNLIEWNENTLMTDTVIDFIRHGEPEGGRRFRGHGVDDPLSEKGWAQMWAAVPDTPPWTQIISSPLLRCRQFAEALAESCDIAVSIEDRFKEVGFGEWEGKSPAQLQQQDAAAYVAFYRDPLQNRPAGAEPWDQFAVRVSAALDDVSKNFSGQQVLVVTHAGVVRAVAAEVLDASANAAYRISVDNASLSRIRYDGNHYRLEYLNRTS